MPSKQPLKGGDISMFKKVIALSTAAMILLTPMSASAVSWGDVVSGLRTKGSYTDGKMTAQRMGTPIPLRAGRSMIT